MYTLQKKFLLCTFVCFAGINSFAQSANIDTIKLSVPGPANQDTTKFATFYVMRPDNDIAKTLWMGIYFDDALMISVDDAMRYIIKYPKTGDIKIWVKNDQVSSVIINVEPGKKYYFQMNTEPGGKTGATKLIQLNDNSGLQAFNAMRYPPIYVYDPDPYTNSKYVWPPVLLTGYEHMQFSMPLSTRHYFVNALDGFKFTYYSKLLSATFTEIDGVYGSEINFPGKDDFEKLVNKKLTT